VAKRNSKGRFVKSSHRKHRRKAKHVRAANPGRKRRQRTWGAHQQTQKKTHRRAHRRARHVRRYRRRHSNPRFSVSGITNQLMPAAYGAAGAIALDVALGYIPLPAMLQSGYAKSATKIVGALGIGWLARKFLRGKGSAVAAGALTVAVYGLMKQVIVQFAPSVKGLGDYEEIAIDNTADQIGAYMSGSNYLPDGSSVAGMGAYMSGAVDDSYDRDGAVLTGMSDY